MGYHPFLKHVEYADGICRVMGFGSMVLDLESDASRVRVERDRIDKHNQLEVLEPLNCSLPFSCKMFGHRQF